VPRISPLLVVLGLSGCSARVQHGLDERQANEIQTVLVERGFQARKQVEDGRPPTWAIEVESAEAADAVRILAELGLPRPHPSGVRELLKPGLVPDPTEQHALLLEAQSGELARTLEAVDGVVSARVHLVRPQPGRPGLPSSLPKASVYLRVHPAAVGRLATMREQLRALVAGGVEGLEASGVTLVTSEIISTVPARPGAVARASVGPSWRVAAAASALLAALGAALLALRRFVLRPREPGQGVVAIRPVVQGPVKERAA
jgi:type III secretion protein J